MFCFQARKNTLLNKKMATIRKKQKMNIEIIDLTMIEVKTLVDLPNEMILKILSQVNINDLFQCMKVNKKIKDISNDISLWETVHLKSKEDVPAELLPKILEKGCKYFAFPLFSKFKGIANFTPNFELKYLYFWAGESDEVFFDLAASCHGLENLAIHFPLEFSIFGTRNLNKQWLPKLTKCISQNRGNLKVLVMNDCEISNKVFELMVTLLVELTELNIKGLKISLKSIDFFCKNITTKLKKLDISWHYMFGDDQLKILMTRCELTELNITETMVTNDSVNSIVQKLPKCLAKLEIDKDTFSISNLLKIAHGMFLEW